MVKENKTVSNTDEKIVMVDDGTKEVPEDMYICEERWSAERPHTLVIACSDGRLQTSIDRFLFHHLGIENYDRLYAPGGPGAMASGGFEYMRADVFRQQFLFLLLAHETEQVIFIAHGAADDSTKAPVCAHYHRIMPRATAAEIKQKQREDVATIIKDAGPALLHVKVRAYRAEVMEDLRIQYVDIAPSLE